MSLSGGCNVRGVATVLSLSAFLKGYSHWSKNLIFVISDGHLEGMQAWLNSFHSSSQSNLHSDILSLPHGVVWTALNIDYPGHSFSHLGVFREGINGRLPNQDLINSFRVVSHNLGVPVVLYDHIDPSEYPGHQQLLALLPSWLPKSLVENPVVLAYVYRARNILRHAGYQARGLASGVHGLFHQYRIDAITIYAVPSNGPHGFHALGRIIESTMRTMNNLLERLHASFFFYIMLDSGKFLKIGMYLPSAILVGAALMFGGLGSWVAAGWHEVAVEDEKTDDSPSLKWVRRPRDLIPALQTVIGTHLLGAALFLLLQSRAVRSNPSTSMPILAILTSALPLLTTVFARRENTAGADAPAYLILKATTLCLASTLISVTSLLNFSLAALLALALGAPLCVTGPTGPSATRFIKYGVYAVLASGWLFLHNEVQHAMWQWEVLGVWFAPLVCIVYTPFMLQAGLASL